ncbi:hypothetical protein DPMN_105269 [Dreissena polymorpha]|uniref:Uncharacterized protein n=1 Tax=Dreissena polymorpha TaxID=45954 RepID=A0A9D4K0S5_DREPO|nr:hypothetical protein DPMN_105269 [Dreissena polymorpha]
MTPVTYATALYRNLLRLNGLGYLFRNVSIGMTDHGDVRNRGFLLKIKCDSVTVLRNVRQKFKTLNLKDKSVARIFCRTLHGSTQNEHNNNIHDIDYITFTNCDNDTCKILRNELLLLPNFVSEEEEKQVVLEVEPYLKRLRYESSHWDDAIHQYRETEKLKWSEKNAIIIQRIRDVAFPQGVKQISFVHVLDLKKEGFIKPHVDAVKVGTLLHAEIN